MPTIVDDIRRVFSLARDRERVDDRKGRVIVDVDYSQLEIRMAAHYEADRAKKMRGGSFFATRGSYRRRFESQSYGTYDVRTTSIGLRVAR